MVNNNDSSGTKKPGKAGRHKTYRAGSKHYHGITFLDAALLGSLVASGHHVGQKDRVFQVHAFRNYGGAHIGVRYPYVFGLSTIIASTSVGIAEKAADGCGFRI